MMDNDSLGKQERDVSGTWGTKSSACLCTSLAASLTLVDSLELKTK